MSRGLLLLLPPSETKRDGGNAASGAGESATGALHFPQLAAVRERTRRDLVSLCRNPEAARTALKLSERLAGRELARNLELADDPPLMPAVLRYTGVLYDALDAGSLDAAARGWLAGHVAVQSALYGLTGADEPIAAYRLSAGSRLPGESLRARWSAACGPLLAQHGGLVVDLRSKGYAALAPLPPGAVTVEVVASGPDGERALGHFNKAAKGRFVRALAQAAPASDPAEAGELAELARSLGLTVRAEGTGRLVLTADEAAPPG